MKHDIEKYLIDAQEAAQDIQQFTVALSFEGYTNDKLVKAAVERKFEIIGEALNRVKKENPNALAKINEAIKIIAFRNLIIHGYDTVSDPILWDVLQNKLPILVADIRALLSTFE
ncbi:MAG TPA: DUF86 domain-containing protein [Bacteroidetes bacterium]|nr:DUF86 domain-containing protein [Bacteroidota bacterium]